VTKSRTCCLCIFFVYCISGIFNDGFGVRVRDDFGRLSREADIVLSEVLSWHLLAGIVGKQAKSQAA
jgi:hypothetical protein